MQCCISEEQAAGWALREVVERWHQLCKGSVPSQRFICGETLDSAELARLAEVADGWRARLMDGTVIHYPPA
ncbi:hypothetical protein [Microbulbifer rhizosphaerae]|uniref:Uncharacterized protein n=1 Tax=Microbulbifer rhizosphaerae TaxID=1562603 RepID=A0A7W4Z950_9GAMM|nr:hypothetical protein [Microbulbifer rhizosphaerae]MBB3061287.1 hypothetical protein [Microbulbifer rhizosphaerae]